MGSRGSNGQGHAFQECGEARFTDPVIEIWNSIQNQRRGKSCGQLAGLIHQHGQRSQEYGANSSIAGGALIHPEAREAVYANHQQQNSNQLYQHVTQGEADDMREQGDPLVHERRIGGLRKSGIPLFVPGVEPVLGVM